MMHVPCRAVLAMCLLGMVTLVPHASASASQSVDPATLNTPLPAWFSCQMTGGGVICQAALDLGADQFGDTGLPCGSGTIWEQTHTYKIGFTVYYTSQADGGNGPGYYVTRFVRHDRGTFLESLFPIGAGRTIPWDGDMTTTFTFAVPGDWSSATQTITGRIDTSHAPGTGLIFHDVGKIVFPADPNGALVIHGPHDLVTDFDGGVAELCQALLAP